MKDGKWIALDKALVNFLPKDRPYTVLEAMFSYSKDIHENCENSINSYARIWSWSRCKVRRFITDLKTGARHAPDRDKTGARHAVRIIINNLQDTKDTGKTPARQGQDTDKTITINNNPNKMLYEEIINDLNLKGGFKYKDCDSTRREINGRITEGFTKEDFFTVHSNMIFAWKNDLKMKQYLRPDTLYRASKFQGYLNSAAPTKMKTIQNQDGMFIEVPA